MKSSYEALVIYKNNYLRLHGYAMRRWGGKRKHHSHASDARLFRIGFSELTDINKYRRYLKRYKKRYKKAGLRVRSESGLWVYAEHYCYPAFFCYGGYDYDEGLEISVFFLDFNVGTTVFIEGAVPEEVEKLLETAEKLLETTIKKYREDNKELPKPSEIKPTEYYEGDKDVIIELVDVYIPPVWMHHTIKK